MIIYLLSLFDRKRTHINYAYSISYTNRMHELISCLWLNFLFHICQVFDLLYLLVFGIRYILLMCNNTLNVHSAVCTHTRLHIHIHIRVFPETLNDCNMYFILLLVLRTPLCHGLPNRQHRHKSSIGKYEPYGKCVCATRWLHQCLVGYDFFFVSVFSIVFCLSVCMYVCGRFPTASVSFLCTNSTSR